MSGYIPKETVYGNPISQRYLKQIAKFREKIARQVGYDPNEVYDLGLTENKQLGSLFGVQNIVRSTEKASFDTQNAVVVATARSGFGPYRAAIAIASCANALGLKPYWLDLHAIEGVPGDFMKWWDDEYSRLSRFSQHSKLYDRYVWEYVTSGRDTLPGLSQILNMMTNMWSWKYLQGYLRDYSTSSLMGNLYAALPETLPILTTHPWNAQAAVAGGNKAVYNLVLDNWPVAFWLAEGAGHYIQSPSAYYGYRTLAGFTEDDRILKPIPEESIQQVGHYIDHELVSNIEVDCSERLSRAASGEPRRFLISMGGAGAQRELFKSVIEHLLPRIKKNQAALFVNLGDHRGNLDWIMQQLGDASELVQLHEDWDSTTEFVESIRDGRATGLHFFLHEEILHAVYATNYLMRVSDVLITKPSELAFYPIPKISNKRVGGHEAWGAIRSAEIGDGTTEARTTAHTLHAIDLMIEDTALLSLYCESIVKNKSIGIYHGGYKVCEMVKESQDPKEH